MRPALWSRTIVLGALVAGATLDGVLPRQVRAQLPRTASPVSSSEAAILQALASDQRTAGYRFGLSRREGQLVLSGRVGSKFVHDVAIRIAMEVTPSLQDDLVIDTSSTPPPPVQEVLTSVPVAASIPGPWPNQPPTYTTWSLGGMTYTYPAPLFGVIDEPFLGFEPPAISYPPYWGALTAVRRVETARALAAEPAARGGATRPADQASAPRGPEPARPSIEMTIDDEGVATLKGRVASETIRRKVREQIAAQPGVTRVIDELTLAPGTLDRPVPVPAPPAPQPPGSTPDQVPTQTPLVPPSPKPGTSLPPRSEPRLQVSGSDPALVQRIDRAIARRIQTPLPDLRIEAQEGAVRMAGTVPGIWEAMQVYRAVEQTPGVRQIDDRLKFAVPAPDQPNPLRDRGQPEDIQAYLLAQIARQAGDSAHIQRVQIDGERLKVVANLADSSDRDRLEAMLRTMPSLRGFKIESDFQVP